MADSPPLDYCMDRPPPSSLLLDGLALAVLIPCYNEESSIAKVVSDFRKELPNATIYVYDNNSLDRTAQVAAQAGGIVGRETLQGKGHVVRRMFSDVDADVYVLVDGDDTYDASAAPAMIELLVRERLDMVNATRITRIAQAYRPGHRLGNAALTGLVGAIFGKHITDMLSGYRVFSRRFVKSFPALASGFETETELTIHALELRMPIGELPTGYRDRPAGSASKLRTYADGFRIFRTILLLIKEEKPLQLFCLTGALLLVSGLRIGLPVVAQFAQTGLVPKLPSAVLATGCIVLSFLCFACGLILDSVMRGRKEMKRLAYLSVPLKCHANAASGIDRED